MVIKQSAHHEGKTVLTVYEPGAELQNTGGKTRVPRRAPRVQTQSSPPGSQPQVPYGITRASREKPRPPLGSEILAGWGEASMPEDPLPTPTHASY